jgi:predicted ester cyclase
MSDQLRADIRRFTEEMNKSNFDILDELYDPDHILHQPPFPDIKGLKAFKRFHANFLAAFPDSHVTIDEIIVEGNMTVVMVTQTGTNTGQSKVFPFPPTGKRVKWSGCTVSRRVEGKTVESWNLWDQLGLLQQLGIVPAMG